MITTNKSMEWYVCVDIIIQSRQHTIKYLFPDSSS